MAQTDILRRTSQLLSEGELVRKKQFFCIASNNTGNSLSFYFIQYTNCTVLNAPSQRSNAKIYLSSGSASLQTFQETDTKICETSVDYSETESNASVCYELQIL